MSKREYIITVYNELMVHLIKTYPRMFNAKQNTLASFTASAMTSWTRSYDVTRKGERRELGLIPLGDLINHKSGIPFDHWWMETADTVTKGKYGKGMSCSLMALMLIGIGQFLCHMSSRPLKRKTLMKRSPLVIRTLARHSAGSCGQGSFRLSPNMATMFRFRYVQCLFG